MIKKDIPRTALIQNPKDKVYLQDILIQKIEKHPYSGYVQGMNFLTAIIYFATGCDRILTDAVVDLFFRKYFFRVSQNQNEFILRSQFFFEQVIRYNFPNINKILRKENEGLLFMGVFSLNLLCCFSNFLSEKDFPASYKSALTNFVLDCVDLILCKGFNIMPKVLYVIFLRIERGLEERAWKREVKRNKNSYRKTQSIKNYSRRRNIKSRFNISSEVRLKKRNRNFGIGNFDIKTLTRIEEESKDEEIYDNSNFSNQKDFLTKDENSENDFNPSGYFNLKWKKGQSVSFLNDFFSRDFSNIKSEVGEFRIDYEIAGLLNLQFDEVNRKIRQAVDSYSKNHFNSRLG